MILNGYIDDELFFGDEITPGMLHDMLYGQEENPIEDIHIKLNSYGGSCNAAVRMHDELVDYPGRVLITVSGTAASAATVLAMAADRLEMSSGSLWMIHDPSMLAIGNERELMEAVGLLQACKESIIDVYRKRCRLDRNMIADMMSKTTWMDCETALTNGFIDGVTHSNTVGIVNMTQKREDAEKMVQNWVDRRKKHPEVISRENQTEMAEKAEMPGSPPAEKPEPAGKQNDPGVPISQLYKRLALIMP